MSINETILRLLNGLVGRSTFSDQLIVFTADYLGWVLLVGLVMYFALAPRPLVWRERSAKLEEFLLVIASLVFAWVLAQLLKLVFIVPRPFSVLTDIHVLLGNFSDSAFPSGHASAFFALGLALWFTNRRLGTIYVWLAVLIGLARVTAGAHWPSDVFFGFVLGGLVAAAIHSGARFLLNLRPRL